MSKVREWLNDRDFYEMCYAYRTAPLLQPAQTVGNFEALKNHIEAKFIDLTGGTMEEEPTNKSNTIAILQTVSEAITIMYKAVESNESNVLTTLNRLHGISYPYPYKDIDRYFYDAYKSLRDLQLKLREAAVAIIVK